MFAGQLERAYQPVAPFIQKALPLPVWSESRRQAQAEFDCGQCSLAVRFLTGGRRLLDEGGGNCDLSSLSGALEQPLEGGAEILALLCKVRQPGQLLRAAQA